MLLTRCTQQVPRPIECSLTYPIQPHRFSVAAQTLAPTRFREHSLHFTCAGPPFPL